MATQPKIETASVLAFERKLDPSDALLYACTWPQRETQDAWQPLSVREKSVRGTISNRLKAKDQDAAKLDAKIENPNLQTVDVVTLPADADTLVVDFTLRVLSGTGTPSACNSAPYRDKLLGAVNAYASATGFAELAARYAHNLANGRFVWRNRLGAEQVQVRVSQWAQGQAVTSWQFDALQLSLRDFAPPTDAATASAVSELAEHIAQALQGQSHLLLRVTTWVRAGAGQEVFPSQELILDKDSSKKSKTLYQVQEVAAIHSQKIGNALRTIDTWHPQALELGPIAVEPYGSVTTLGKACRRPTDKLDFYNLLDAWILKDQVPDLAQQHFVMATLVRGGVFGDAGKD